MVVFKNRYMVMEIFLDSNKYTSGNDPIIISQFNISKAIKDSILLNFGECGLAISLGSFQVKYVNPITKLCIIRASREDHQKVWSSITMVRSIGNCPVVFNLLDLSGSIRACKKAALKCDEAKFEQYKLARGDSVTPETTNLVQSYFEKIGLRFNTVVAIDGAPRACREWSSPSPLLVAIGFIKSGYQSCSEFDHSCQGFSQIFQSRLLLSFGARSDRLISSLAADRDLVIVAIFKAPHQHPGLLPL